MKKLILATACVGALLGGQAMAGTSTGTITSSATIVEGCVVAANNLDFGAVGMLNVGNDATSSATITCTPGLAYIATIVDADNPANDNFSLKNLDGDEIAMSLYQDTTRSILWNSTSGVSATSTDSNQGQTYTIYGRIPVQSAQPAGLYSMNANLVVTY